MWRRQDWMDRKYINFIWTIGHRETDRNQKTVFGFPVVCILL